MRFVILTDADQHDAAEALRHAYGDKLIALEAEHVAEADRHGDAGILAASLVSDLNGGQTGALSELGLSASSLAELSDALLDLP